MARPPSMTLEQFDPALADLLVDQTQRTVGKSSTKKLLWRCPAHLGDPRHVYPSQVGNKTASNDPLRCNVCIGKHVIPGINDMATTAPQAASLLVDQGLATSLTAASNKKVELHCGIPAHDSWTAPLSNVAIQGTGCPQCSGRIAVVGTDDLATTHPTIAAMLADPSRASLIKAGSTSRKEAWRCPVHPDRHPHWQATPHDVVTSKTPCPTCRNRIVVPGVNDLATTHPILARQLVEPSYAQRVRAGSETPVMWRCRREGHPDWSASPRNRTVVGSGCPVCANRVVVPGVNDLATTAPTIAALLEDQGLATTVTRGTGTVLEVQCPDVPEHTWPAPAYRLTGAKPTGCPMCRASAGEKDLALAMRALLPNTSINTSDRTLLANGQELDIVLPEFALAIEFNGVYWHSEAAGRGASYHQTKTHQAAERGYRLLHIWEDDWVHRRGPVLRALAHRCAAVDRLPAAMPEIDPKAVQRSHARELSVQQVPPRAAAEFLEANHIQGPVSAGRHLGLLDSDGDLRALLSLRSPDHNARLRRTQGQWEVQRYATLGIVPGGFSRLLAQAERLLRDEGQALTQWVSFSDDTISDGGLYAATGFIAERRLPPDYRYVGTLTGWRREPKERYQKKRFRQDPDLLWDESWTEHEAALSNRLYRIYDAGKTRWVKQV